MNAMLPHKETLRYILEVSDMLLCLGVIFTPHAETLREAHHLVARGQGRKFRMQTQDGILHCLGLGLAQRCPHRISGAPGSS